MLLFHGLKQEFGSTEKFTQHYDLTQSLKLALDAELRHGAPAEAFAEADLEGIINSRFSSKSSRSMSQDLRRELAVIIRAKDICRFIRSVDFPQEAIEVLSVFLEVKSLEDKWLSAKSRIINSVVPILSKPLPEEVCVIDSSICRLISAVELFFMDQTDEKPTANTLLRFIPNDFPKHVWVTTDKVGEASDIKWRPKLSFCSKDFLIADLLTEQHRNHLTQTLTHRQQLAPQTNPKLEQEAIEITFPDADKNTPTLPFSDAMEESFVRFQKTIKKLYKDEGIKILAGVLYCLSKNSSQESALLSVEELFDLLYDRQKTDLVEKRMAIMQEVLDSLLSIQVKRTGWQDGQKVERVNQLLCVKSSILLKPGEGERKSRPIKFELIKDRLLIRDSDNLKPLGFALQFMPTDFFKHGSKEYAYFFEIGAFLANCWYDEFEEKKGVAHKSPQNIINQSGLYFPKSGEYRALQAIKRTLTYMSEKNFISHLFFGGDTPKTSKLEQLFTIVAPEQFIHSLQHSINNSPNSLTPIPA